MTDAEWRPVPDYPGVFASSDGRIRGKAGGVMKPMLTDWGYWRVSVKRSDGKLRSPRVHQLVCMAFHPAIEGKPHVNHIDGDKLNNRQENLEWISKKENEAHAHAIGRSHAATNPARGHKLSVDDVKNIRKRAADGEHYPAIYAAYPHVSDCHVYKIIRGQKRVLG